MEPVTPVQSQTIGLTHLAARSELHLAASSSLSPPSPPPQPLLPFLKSLPPDLHLLPYLLAPLLLLLLRSLDNPTRIDYVLLATSATVTATTFVVTAGAIATRFPTNPMAHTDPNTDPNTAPLPPTSTPGGAPSPAPPDPDPPAKQGRSYGTLYPCYRSGVWTLLPSSLLVKNDIIAIQESTTDTPTGAATDDVATDSSAPAGAPSLQDEGLCGCAITPLESSYLANLPPVPLAVLPSNPGKPVHHPLSPSLLPLVDGGGMSIYRLTETVLSRVLSRQCDDVQRQQDTQPIIHRQLISTARSLRKYELYLTGAFGGVLVIRGVLWLTGTGEGRAMRKEGERQDAMRARSANTTGERADETSLRASLRASLRDL